MLAKIETPGLVEGPSVLLDPGLEKDDAVGFDRAPKEGFGKEVVSFDCPNKEVVFETVELPSVEVVGRLAPKAGLPVAGLMEVGVQILTDSS